MYMFLFIILECLHSNDSLTEFLFCFTVVREFRPNAFVQSRRVGFLNVMSAYSATTNYQTPVESYRPRSPQRANTPPSATSRSSDQQTSPRSVSFGKNNKREEEKDKRTKYLTARYGQHQMMLIRKRLAVEDWLYEQLREMYNCEVRVI